MLTYKTITDKGNREINEDSIRYAEHNGAHCFIVADGLGGHGKGDEASSVVCDKIVECFKSYNGNAKNFIGEAIETAQAVLLEEQEKRAAKYQMKTTLVVLVVDGKTACWGHVGDSRLYYFSKGHLKLRTIDHSVPQMLVLAKSIKEKEIRHHPDRNKLLRVLGITWERTMYELNSTELKLNGKQAFLLCTDGFWELVEDKEMQSFLKKSKTVSEWLDAMTEKVIENGKDENMDNYSAIAIIV